MRNNKEKVLKLINALSKYEVYFFYSIVLINLIPLFITKYFPTVDGPAHLYNARLIIDLLANNASPLAEYFVFNSNLNPNWSAHFILSGLLLIFPAFLAEKILLMSYLLFFPVSFRFLFKTLNIQENYLLYFIFPFTYSFMFYFGFYNFHIGLIFFFITIGFWVKFLKSGLNYPRLLLLLFLTLCVFFSHLFILAMLFMVITLLNLKDFIALFKSTTDNKNSIIKSILLQIAVIFPVVVLTLFYFYSNPIVAGTFDYLSSHDLWKMVQQVQPAKGISYGKEAVFAKWIFILLSLIAAYLLILRIKHINKPLKNSTLTWGLLALITLVGLFVLPNGTPTFGFISSRLVLFFFLFLIIFLATHKVPLWLKVVSFILINYVNIALLKIYVQSSAQMNIVSENILSASENIKPYSTVLPINESDNWIFSHISNYLGADKPMIILENYEASLNYFPLKWNPERKIKFQLDSMEELLNTFPMTAHNHQEQVDYIFLLADPKLAPTEEQENNIKTLLENYYELIYQSEDKSIKLFKNAFIEQ